MKFTDTAFSVLVGAVAARRAPDPLTRKLRAFGTLPAGWNHGEGGPVSPEAIRLAQVFVDLAISLQLAADVFPGINGDCSVTYHRDDKSVEVVVNAIGAPDSLGLHVEQGCGFQFQSILERDATNYDEVVSEISKLLTSEWKSRASSRFGSSTQSRVAFQTWSSSTPQAMPWVPLMGS